MIRFDEGNQTPAKILKTIRNCPDAKEYTYVICGTPGPTGKTTLRRDLVNLGYNAVEISGMLISSVTYWSNGNDVQVDERNKCVLIVLNKALPL